MQDDHISVREIGTTTATRLMTLARQLAVELRHHVESAPGRTSSRARRSLDSEVREAVPSPRAMHDGNLMVTIEGVEVELRRLDRPRRVVVITFPSRHPAEAVIS